VASTLASHTDRNMNIRGLPAGGGRTKVIICRILARCRFVMVVDVAQTVGAELEPAEGWPTGAMRVSSTGPSDPEPPTRSAPADTEVTTQRTSGSCVVLCPP
jgi:hypothetical protein